MKCCVLTLWSGEGHSVPYSALTDCFDKIDQTTKRLVISQYLTEFLLKVALNPGENGDDLKRVVYLCINRVGAFLFSLVWLL